MSNRGEYYTKADYLSNNLTIFYKRFMGLLTCGYMIYPLQLALYQMYNNVNLISWQLPIKVE